MRTLFASRRLFGSVSLPVLPWLALPLLTLAGAGCNAVPYSQYRQAQIQSLQMRQQNRALASQLGQTQQMATQLQAEKMQLEMASNQLSGSLQIANERLGNFTNERGQLHEKYRGLLTGLPGPGSQLPSSVIEQFRALAAKYPEFEFDPVAGVAKFNGSLLFSTGSDALRPEAHRLLQDFSQIMNDAVARNFNVLVVGHTDDVRIAKEVTRAKHPTNWDLSAHRATAVVRQLASFGISEPRMGIAGYSMYQPTAANTDERARQQNRRVEIFVIAPDNAVAAAGTFPQ